MGRIVQLPSGVQMRSADEEYASVLPRAGGRECHGNMCWHAVMCGAMWLHGMARDGIDGVAWCGTDGVAWCGIDGVAWCGIDGVARDGTDGVAWDGLGSHGVVWCGKVWQGVAHQLGYLEGEALHGAAPLHGAMHSRLGAARALRGACLAGEAG